MPKLTILAPANVNHTHKWAHALAERGYRVTVVTQHAPAEEYDTAITIEQLPHSGFKGYFLNRRALQRMISADAPDIIHVHYASGYGTLAALAIKQPYLLSVWGSDVYEFPYRSAFHKLWIQWSLKRAARIASTSDDMARQVCDLIGETPVEITPFGVHLDTFAATRTPFSDNRITIGTAKKLDPRYGIDVLIKGFAALYHNAEPELQQRLSLRLVGDGPQRAELEALAESLGIRQQVTFVGAVPSYQVPEELNKMDIVVLSSRIESFGVSAVEALAAKRPTIAAKVGGLPEIIVHEKTGLLIETESPEQLQQALHRLITQPDDALRLAESGFQYAHQRFSMTATTDRMVEVLNTMSPPS
jgi:glycosyltransferase involved in cell wall biosynthesis